MLKLIKPDIFERDERVTALFTVSNRDSIHTNHPIPGLDLGFNTDTDQAIIHQNYKLLANTIGQETLNLALARQIHGSNIGVVDMAGIYSDTDGLVTTIPGLAIGIQVADCAAVLVADSTNRVIGAFHAGWRGAAGGIIPKGIEKMESLNGQPEQCKAYISPCISLKHFEVGEEVARQFPDEFCEYQRFPKPHVDLKACIVHQLVESGLKKENIERSEGCTMADDTFYSYRRERERAGRMLAMIVIEY